tara:strand:+ start:851 stop:1063 length:213 start_codon:yes stop_codon:yes gene_type:complete
MNKPEYDNLTGRGEEYLIQIMTSDDPQLLRAAALEMIVIVGHIYKRLQLHMVLHPAFFLAGFLSCYFFIK